MKIFQTQLQGLIRKIDDYEESFEEATRYIAQSMISDGKVYIFGDMEMVGIIPQALNGVDRLPGCLEASETSVFTPLDTVLIFSPNKGSKAAAKVADNARGAGGNVIGVFSETTENDGDMQIDWTSQCTVSFSTSISHGLMPTESGDRIGVPHLLVALHFYYALYFTTMEFMEEFEE
ncbi:DUF2529 family protein [Evansella cellulosilytica]|uniref:DUF2529 domain-containing protein n=1 Tax=Evansella cellulosilytica (strain ATCC 21833 / DSM 2522 / FERM P-1141 / JCM 9156 / N-4) TaxID=649639 RepID=E6TXE0_EVAC2|nr:DUF2529 family protein [Evansella cellulosilytica]ADU32335.1 Protein of unknown function DUF2529 [Evansella cellulosilytica DSM 2522]